MKRSVVPMPSIRWKRHRRVLLLLLLIPCAFLFRGKLRAFTTSLIRWAQREHSVRSRLAQFSETVRLRLEPDFKRAGVPYPPVALAYIALKEEAILQVYAAGEDRRFRFTEIFQSLRRAGALARSSVRATCRFQRGFTARNRSIPTAGSTWRCGWAIRISSTGTWLRPTGAATPAPTS